MTPDFLQNILFDVSPEYKRASWLKRTILTFLFGSFLWIAGINNVWGGETDFKAYRKAAQKEIILQKAIIEQDPLDFKSYFELGLIYLKLGRHKDEVQAYEEALSLNPKSALTHYNLSVAYDHLKEGSKAIHHMERAQDLYISKRNHRKIRTTQRQLKRYYMSYPGLSGEKVFGR